MDESVSFDTLSWELQLLFLDIIDSNVFDSLNIYKKKTRTNIK